MGTIYRVWEATMKNSAFTLILVGIVGFTLVLGCADAKPFKYHSGNEIPEGPGVLTREKGEFTIYDSNKKQPAAIEQAQPVSATPAPATVPEEGEAFRQFQEWKKEQSEFESFQQWKRSQQGAKEYQEFQEWKRWKEYQRWNDKQNKSNKIDY